MPCPVRQGMECQTPPMEYGIRNPAVLTTVYHRHYKGAWESEKKHDVRIEVTGATEGQVPHRFPWNRIHRPSITNADDDITTPFFVHISRDPVRL